MTYQEAAQAAIKAQDACNLSGVVHTFHQVVEVLWDEAKKIGKGTDWVNKHSISYLFASKIGQLAFKEDLSMEACAKYGYAFKVCKDIAEGGGTT